LSISGPRSTSRCRSAWSPGWRSRPTTTSRASRPAIGGRAGAMCSGSGAAADLLLPRSPSSPAGPIGASPRPAGGQTMLGSKGWLERRPELYLPYIGHVLPHVVLLQDGSYMMVAHLRGAPWQLDYNETRNMRRDRRSVLLQSISEPGRLLYEHLVHHQCVEPPADLSYSTGFPADLSGAYRRKVLNGKTWRNDWFISLIARPEMIGVATLNRNRPKRAIRPSEIDETVIRSLEEAMRSIVATLADFEPTVLSYRDEPIPVSVDP